METDMTGLGTDPGEPDQHRRRQYGGRDPLKGGRVVVGHVVSIDTRSDDNGPERLIATPTASTPVPWKGGELDRRLAAAFDVMGIKTGMSPADVSRIAKAELGQTLVFNENTGTLASPATDCELEFLPDGTPPPLGRRCFVGTFLKPAARPNWELTKFRLTQTHATELLREMSLALRAKYGTYDLAQSYPGRTAPSSLQFVMQNVPTFAAGWGARLSAERPEADDVPFPLHPLELLA